MFSADNKSNQQLPFSLRFFKVLKRLLVSSFFGELCFLFCVYIVLNIAIPRFIVLLNESSIHLQILDSDTLKPIPNALVIWENFPSSRIKLVEIPYRDNYLKELDSGLFRNSSIRKAFNQKLESHNPLMDSQIKEGILQIKIPSKEWFLFDEENLYLLKREENLFILYKYLNDLGCSGNDGKVQYSRPLAMQKVYWAYPQIGNPGNFSKQKLLIEADRYKTKSIIIPEYSSKEYWLDILLEKR